MQSLIATPTQTQGRAWPMGTVATLAAWLAVIVYAASNPIVAQLVQIGEMNLTKDGRNAITFTNLLVLGSALSLLPLSLLNRRDLTRAHLRGLTRGHWGIIAVSAILSSALTPGLFFFALENTSVTNMILVGRIEPPLFLLATWLVLGERLNIWTFGAGLIALLGAVVILSNGTSGGFQIGIGEMATLGATLSYTASSLIARVGLKDIPVGLFMVIRTVLGTTVYFAFTSYVFGLDIYRDIFSPILMKWIWIYIIAIVVTGQLLWIFALKHARAGDVSMATSFSPLIAIVIAMVLLGEDPGTGLIPGGTVMILAVCFGQCGAQLFSHTQKAVTGSVQSLRSLAHSTLNTFDDKILRQANLI